MRRVELSFLLAGVCISFFSLLAHFAVGERNYLPEAQPLVKFFDPLGVITAVTFGVINLRVWSLLVALMLGEQESLPEDQPWGEVKKLFLIALKFSLILLLVVALSILGRDQLVPFILGLVAFIFGGSLVCIAFSRNCDP